MTYRPRRSSEPVTLPPHVSHGTNNAYNYYHCGCDPCRDTARRYLAERRARHRAKRVMRRGRWYAPDARHGTRVGYDLHGCRCPPCTSARSHAFMLPTTAFAQKRAQSITETEESE